MVLGLLIMGVAIAQMLMVGTTIMPRRDSSTLITGGIFRLSRNPIYLADTVLLAGFYLHWDALLALPLVPFFIAIIQRRFIAEEEARLERDYGGIFTDYMQTTRRWI